MIIVRARRVPARRASPAPPVGPTALQQEMGLKATSGRRPVVTIAGVERVKATIPEPADQIRSRLRSGSRGGRPPAFDSAAYKQRNTVERAFCPLRQHRAVATRYDKRDFVWRGTVDVASIRIWLRHPVP